ncbi:polysaccharide pyruvyl transferase family protein [Schlegelella sp. S2-27]|uniref:Polysaccharide pyruvyl transferase family protein n=1 Tax=Caldimonas mangrovi TaxID=2944811 RepID=A0ABT0YL46_9BURK|nr:polysaccharide pyruvyl transferase family protein [Caldimonas mangrovi]MCM5679450.1 polysaccharide pyruvyl transferase family protein [Caldimonas mangrovi]
MKRYTLVNDTTPDLHIGSDAVVRTIRQAAKVHGYTEAAAHRVSTEITGKDYHRLLSGSELIVINGEGTLHGDSRGCKNIAHFAAVAKSEGKRVALINSCYSDNSQITADLLMRCDLLAFRESHAASSFCAQQPDAQPLVVGDLSLQSFPRAARSSSGARIAVTDSVLDDATRALLQIGQHFGADYACVKDFKLLSSKNVPLRSAWQVFAQGARRLRPHPSLLLNVLRHQSRATFHASAQRAALLITGRFHAVMYCLCNQMPFLYIASNTAKIDHVLRDAGLDIARRKISGLDDVRRLGAQPAELVRAAAFTPAEEQGLRLYLQQQQAAADALLRTVFA